MFQSPRNYSRNGYIPCLLFYVKNKFLWYSNTRCEFPYLFYSGHSKAYLQLFVCEKLLFCHNNDVFSHLQWRLPYCNSPRLFGLQFVFFKLSFLDETCLVRMTLVRVSDVQQNATSDCFRVLNCQNIPVHKSANYFYFLEFLGSNCI